MSDFVSCSFAAFNALSILSAGLPVMHSIDNLHLQHHDDDDDDDDTAKVVLCSDKGVNQTMMDHTMAHELIHAYDQCRVKLDRTNCLHVACTEVHNAARDATYHPAPLSSQHEF